MNKQEKIDLIVAYMEGNVRDEEVELFYQLLETDKEFEELVGEYHQIDMLLEEMFPDDDEEDTFIENEFDVKDENQKKITLTTQMGKNQKTKKNMFLMRWIAASVLLLLSIGFIYYLNPSTKNNQKITKNKNQTDKSLDKKENINPKIDKDSLKNEKDNVVEKEEIEIVLPKKEKIEEKIAVIPNDIKQKFESKNRSLEAMAEDGSSRSTKSFKIIVPQNNENFKDKIIFKWEWEWEKENTEPMLMLSILDRFGNEYKKFEINTKEKKSSYIINVSDFEPALYYFQISTTQESIPYTGRFFVRKPF